MAIEETWSFFRDLFEDFQRHYEVTQFERKTFQLAIFNTRINRYRLNRDMDRFLARNDVVFFEWASGLLSAATQLSQKARIVTRLHRYEMYEWVERINWNRVDRVILVSEAMRRDSQHDFPNTLPRPG